MKEEGREGEDAGREGKNTGMEGKREGRREVSRYNNHEEYPHLPRNIVGMLKNFLPTS